MRNHALELLQTASNLLLVDHSDKRQDCFSRQLQRQRHHHASVDYYLERPALVCPGDRDGEIAEFAARGLVLAHWRVMVSLGVQYALGVAACAALPSRSSRSAFDKRDQNGLGLPPTTCTHPSHSTAGRPSARPKVAPDTRGRP